jgi:hypothetical protein
VTVLAISIPMSAAAVIAWLSAIFFGFVFIRAGIRRLRDTLAGRGPGSRAEGVFWGAFGIALGVVVILFCVRLALHPPDPDSIIPPRGDRPEIPH